jgi:hypothetical protein
MGVGDLVTSGADERFSRPKMRGDLAFGQFLQVWDCLNETMHEYSIFGLLGLDLSGLFFRCPCPQEAGKKIPPGLLGSRVNLFVCALGIHLNSFPLAELNPTSSAPTNRHER